MPILYLPRIADNRFRRKSPVETEEPLVTSSPDKRSASTSHLARTGDPDAHGQASLLLVESILHALVERRVLTPGDALTAVQVAAEVKLDLAAHSGEAIAVRDESLRLLRAIEQSFAAYDGARQRR